MSSGDPDQPASASCAPRWRPSQRWSCRLIVLLAVNLLYEGTRLKSRGNIPYTRFFTPAMIAFAAVNACYTSVIAQVTLARDEGIFKRIGSTPLPPWVYMSGRLCSAGVVATVSAVVVVAVVPTYTTSRWSGARCLPCS